MTASLQSTTTHAISSLRRQHKDTFLLILVTLDLLFLPMFHVGSIPWKPSYFLVLLYIPQIARTRYHRRFLIPSITLLVLFVFGTLTFWVYNGVQIDRATTVTYFTTWIMICAGFAFGFSRHRARLDFLMFLIVAYMLINVYLWFSFNSAPAWLINFYNLKARIEEGLFQYRNMGIMFNPNVTAMGTILMVVFLLIGRQQRLLKLRGTIVMALAFAAAWITLLTLQSRGSIIVLAFMTIHFFHKKLFSLSFLKLCIVVLCLLLVLAIMYGHNETVKARIDRMPVLLHDFDNFFKFSLDESVRVNSILRPFQRAESAVGRFFYSPVWGTGLEISDRPPFNESQYHNDAFVVLAAQGFIGLIAYFALLKRSWKVGIYALAPFINGWVNSFITATSHFIFFSIMLGYFYGVRYARTHGTGKDHVRIRNA